MAVVYDNSVGTSDANTTSLSATLTIGGSSATNAGIVIIYWPGSDNPGTVSVSGAGGTWNQITGTDSSSTLAVRMVCFGAAGLTTGSQTITVTIQNSIQMGFSVITALNVNQTTPLINGNFYSSGAGGSASPSLTLTTVAGDMTVSGIRQDNYSGTLTANSYTTVANNAMYNVSPGTSDVHSWVCAPPEQIIMSGATFNAGAVAFVVEDDLIVRRPSLLPLSVGPAQRQALLGWESTPRVFRAADDLPRLRTSLPVPLLTAIAQAKLVGGSDKVTPPLRITSDDRRLQRLPPMVPVSPAAARSTEGVGAAQLVPSDFPRLRIPPLVLPASVALHAAEGLATAKLVPSDFPRLRVPPIPPFIPSVLRATEEVGTPSLATLATDDLWIPRIRSPFLAAPAVSLISQIQRGTVPETGEIFYPPPQITLVQCQQETVFDFTIGNSVTFVLTPPRPGSALTFAFANYVPHSSGLYTTISGIVGGGVTWVQGPHQQNYETINGENQNVEIWYGLDATGDPGNTNVVISFTNGLVTAAVALERICEWQGPVAFDTSNAAVGTGSATSCPVTTGYPSDVLVTTVVYSGDGLANTPPNWTGRLDNFNITGGSYLITNAQGTYDAPFPLIPPTTYHWVQCVLALKGLPVEFTDPPPRRPFKTPLLLSRGYRVFQGEGVGVPLPLRAADGPPLVTRPIVPPPKGRPPLSQDFEWQTARPPLPLTDSLYDYKQGLRLARLALMQVRAALRGSETVFLPIGPGIRCAEVYSYAGSLDLWSYAGTCDVRSSAGRLSLKTELCVGGGMATPVTVPVVTPPPPPPPPPPVPPPPVPPVPPPPVPPAGWDILRDLTLGGNY